MPTHRKRQRRDEWGTKRVLVNWTCGHFVHTLAGVEVTYDAAKDAENISKHGISLSRVMDFDLDSARFELDDSQDYAEERWNLIGWLDAKLYKLTVVFHATHTRPISLREATRPERKHYAQEY